MIIVCSEKKSVQHHVILGNTISTDRSDHEEKNFRVIRVIRRNIFSVNRTDHEEKIFARYA